MIALGVRLGRHHPLQGLQIAGVAAIAIALFLAVTHLRRDDAATVETDAPLVLIA